MNIRIFINNAGRGRLIFMCTFEHKGLKYFTMCGAAYFPINVDADRKIRKCRQSSGTTAI